MLNIHDASPHEIKYTDLSFILNLKRFFTVHSNDYDRVIAIDPGTKCTAVAIIDCKNGTPVFSEGVIEDNYTVQERLSNFPKNDSVFVIEDIQSYGAPVGNSVFRTCLWVGKFVSVLNEDKTYLIGRSTVAKLLTDKGKGKSMDSRIRSCIKLAYLFKFCNLSVLENVKKDIWSAIAIGHAFVMLNDEERKLISVSNILQ